MQCSLAVLCCCSSNAQWLEISKVEDPRAYHLRNVYEIVRDNGDAWEGFDSFSVPLHTDEALRSGTELSLPESRYYKTPEQLKAYSEKRDFNKTPEPAPSAMKTDGNAFVIHRHHASRLHYDLRLEKDGTLLSWAVPKGMPHKPGIKRLAVQTEPHPIEYLQFDGEIPKGQYGGGKMWIFARGKYEITKEKKDGFYFRLSSPQLAGEFRMHNTKPKEWLLERVDRDIIRILDDPIKVMLANACKDLPKNEQDYLYEVKWDGIRATIHVEEGQVKIRSRSQRDLTAQFPELENVSESFRISNGIFDAEIVCLDSKGKPDFKKVISRMHSSSVSRIQQATKRNPAYAYLFDCLYIDGRSIIHEPLERRRAWCEDSIKKGTNYRFSQSMEDGAGLLEAARKMHLEGIIAKLKGSRYHIGKRTDDWLKIKFRTEEEVAIIGYTEGNNERAATFGALHIAEMKDGELLYRGKVGTGFDSKLMTEIRGLIDALNEIEKPIPQKTEDDNVSIWIEPKIYCMVQYASITNNGTYREPVFQHLIDW